MGLRKIFFTLLLITCIDSTQAVPKHLTHHTKKRIAMHRVKVHRISKHHTKTRVIAKKQKHTKVLTRQKIAAKSRLLKSAKVTKSNQNPTYLLYGRENLAQAINEIIRSSNLKADIAVYVKSMKKSDVLFSRNSNQLMTPASTLKIFTAEAALIFLGPEYRFATQLLTDAKTIKNGILQGNLYVVLNGDPTLNYYNLVDLFLALKSQQIKAIAGNVYVDNTAYDQNYYGPGWEWKDKKYCYAAPISASIINWNCLPLKITPRRPGQVAEIVTSPRYFFPFIRNSVLTKAVRPRACTLKLSVEADSSITIDGCMPKHQTAWELTYIVNNISDYDRALFKNLLHRLSINVYGNVILGEAHDGLSQLNQHTSKPVRLLINEMLKKSNNIIAGALFKKIGQLFTKQPGSWENGSFAVSKIIAEHTGTSISGLRVLDGSGLSPDNLVSSLHIMNVLEFAYHYYPLSYEFISALPVAGIDGTLKHRMGNIARKVRAKTGTISGVVSLAGYAVTSDKEALAFVIMINGDKGNAWRYRNMEDKIATVLTKFKR